MRGQNVNCHHGISLCECANLDIPMCPIHGEGCLHCGDACELEHQIWKKETDALKSSLEKEHENFLAGHRDNMRLIDRTRALQIALQRIIDLGDSSYRKVGDYAEIAKNALEWK